MSSYRVIDVRPDQAIAALRDPVGRNYIVRLNAELPSIAVQLYGTTLNAGQATLLTGRDGQVYSITTEAAGCSEYAVLERLHPASRI